MYLTYFDDTGGTGRNYLDPQQPVQGLCAVSIDETQWRGIERDCRRVVAKHFPKQQVGFLRSGSFELHASAIYQGSGVFSGRPLDERLQLLDDIVSIITTHRLPLTGVYVEKKYAKEILNEFKPIDSMDDFLFAVLYLRLNSKISSRGTSYTILIGDHDSVKPTQAEQYERMFNDPKNSETHVLESVRFVDSHRSFGVQLADTAAFLIRRHLTHPTQSHPASDRLLDWLNGGILRDESGIVRIEGGWF